MERIKIILGVFGFGCVGQGLYNVLEQTKGIKAEIAKICIKHPEKTRSIEESYFTTDRYELLDNPEINVIVELIDDSEAAFEIVKYALEHGKSVVTANKKMIAEHFEELYKLQIDNDVHLLYEGACCASIPIIRNLEEYYDNDLLNGIEGILNGSTNYILSKIFNENLGFDTALKQAQESGFAESDPWLDVSGTDAKYKLCIILAHAFGIFTQPEKIINFGINKINDFDINIAKQRGSKIKLTARCRKFGNEVLTLVAPQFISPENELFRVNNEFNGVIVEGAFSEHQVFIGKGAGSFPTGSAVLSDISALTYDYKYEYKKYHQDLDLTLTNDFFLEIYVRSSKTEINTDDFEVINESYKNNNHKYFVGSINLQKLIDSDWYDADDVNIILTEDCRFKKVM
jgi:homoserine dehydrogenase